MKRILVLYNPRSSRYADVREEVLDKLKDLKGYLIGKYEVEKGDVDSNAAKLAKLIKDDDLIVAAGGDATGVIAVNGIIKSGKKVELAVLPYGNFNDLSRTLNVKNFEQIFSHEASVINYYPLEIIVNDKLFRYATCYVTMGMTAEAVKIYDQPKMRKILKKQTGRSIGSYTNLIGWYFKNRRKKQFLPEFRLNGELQHRKTSDYAAINGRYMARVMKGGDYYKTEEVFRRETDRLTNFWRLFRLMVKSIIVQIPGEETKGDVLEFLQMGEITIQAEGENKKFDNLRKVEIKKSKKCLKVIKI